MRSIKKLLSIVMVLTLVLALGASAFAAAAGTQKVDITVNEKNGEVPGTYKAYQLFTLTTTEKELSDGSGYSYTVNPAYASILYTAAGLAGEKQNNAELVKHLESIKNDAAAVREFADNVYKAIGDMPADFTSENGKFEVPQGYYLIVEEGAAGGAVSQVMLDTAGRENVEITAKEDVPSVDKKVADQNDSKADAQTWGEVADWDINDAVPFQLEATIPAGTTVPYGTYALTFHDTQSEGLTFNANSVKVFVNNGAEPLDSSAYDVNAPGADGCAFDIVFTNIKAIAGFTPEGPSDDVIRVEYTATLNEKAVIGGTGNPNEVSLQYSNNPYVESTGTTPKDKVVVFTFTLNVSKVGPDGKEPLEGAGFTLFKKGADGNWNQIGDELKAAEGESMTVFSFKGLDEGDYKVEETTVPPGYNKADDTLFTVEAAYKDETGENSNVESLTVKDEKGEVISGEGKTLTVDLTKGEIGTTVVNMTGVELPSTGGIGTTIFYVAGGILAAGAVILLVARKRVSGAEK